MPVVFNDSNHTYTNPSGEQYISVTTLIDRYTPPFDENYWSTYKAVKDVLSAKGIWPEFKKKAGGWDYVVDYVRKLGKEFPHFEACMARKKEYIDMWEKKRQGALAKGRKFHDEAEGRTKTSRMILEDMREVEVLSGHDMLLAQDFTATRIYPELVLYDDRLKIAGMADWVFKDGKEVDIKDYKTSEEIEKEAFMEETLKAPLQMFPNANFWKYSLQLSLYGYLLERHGYTVRKLAIEHIRDGQKPEMHPVKYHRGHVINMVNHYDEERKKEYRNLKLSA